MPRPFHTPRPPRYDTAQALLHLSTADPKLAKLIEAAGPFKLSVPSTQSPFEALVESIVYQQLHGKAAATIHRRLLESFGPTLTGPTLAAASESLGFSPPLSRPSTPPPSSSAPPASPPTRRWRCATSLPKPWTAPSPR